jgi:hypothetical protein
MSHHHSQNKLLMSSPAEIRRWTTSNQTYGSFWKALRPDLVDEFWVETPGEDDDNMMAPS